MSKRTVIVCDGCGRSVTGMGYSTLVSRLRGKGWVYHSTHEHYCKRCAEVHTPASKPTEVPHA